MYKVLVGYSPTELEQQVNQFQNDGWECQGGVGIGHPFSIEVVALVNLTEVENRLIFCQAMVK